MSHDMNVDVPSRAQQWLETQQSNMLALLEDLVNIDSNSYDHAGVSAVFDRLEHFFGSFGLKAESHYVNGIRAALSVRVGQADTPERRVMLMGHCDTVFPKGEVARRPFRMDSRR